jgi:hypothetical protein
MVYRLLSLLSPYQGRGLKAVIVLRHCGVGSEKLCHSMRASKNTPRSEPLRALALPIVGTPEAAHPVRVLYS